MNVFPAYDRQVYGTFRFEAEMLVKLLIVEETTPVRETTWLEEDGD